MYYCKKCYEEQLAKYPDPDYPELGLEELLHIQTDVKFDTGSIDFPEDPLGEWVYGINFECPKHGILRTTKMTFKELLKEMEKIDQSIASIFPFSFSFVNCSEPEKHKLIRPEEKILS